MLKVICNFPDIFDFTELLTTVRGNLSVAVIKCHLPLNTY